MPFADTKMITDKGANMMLEAAIGKAREYGIAATVAIVDAGGHLLKLDRMQGGRFHTVHSATAKAVSSASNKRPTTTRGAQGQDLDTLHAIGLTLAAGPIIVDGQCIGGIGVSGGDWEQDEAIARAAIAAVGIEMGA